MPLPTSTSQTPWEDGLTTLLGADVMDRHHFIGMPWISMYSKELVSMNNNNPAGDPVPTGEPGHNQFTLYRKVLESDNTISYMVIHGVVSWYEGPDKATPHDLYVHEFLSHSYAALHPPMGKAVLDDVAFDQAAESFYNTRMWADTTIQTLQNEVDRVNASASGFKGSSADAFTQVMANLRDELKMLSIDMQTNKDWVQLLHDNASQVRQFLRRIGDAYDEWRRTPEPTTMVNAVLQQLRSEANKLAKDTDDVTTYEGNPGYMGNGTASTTTITHSSNVPNASTVTSWPITISIGNDYQTFDFLDKDVFSQVNTFMQNIWTRNAGKTIDSTMITEAGALNDSLTTTTTNLLDTRTFVPPPSPFDDLPGSGGGLGLGGGGGGDLNLDDLFGGGDNNPDLKGGGGTIDLDKLLGGGDNNPDLGGGGGSNLTDLLNGGGQDGVNGPPGGGSIGDIGGGDIGSLDLGTGSNTPGPLSGAGTTGAGAGNLPAAAALVSALGNQGGDATGGKSTTTGGPAAGMAGLTDTNGDGVPDAVVTPIDPAAVTTTNLGSGQNAPSLGGTPGGGLFGNTGPAGGSLSDLGIGNSAPNLAIGSGGPIALPGGKSGPNAFSAGNPPPGAAFGLGTLGPGSSAPGGAGNGLSAGGGGAFGDGLGGDSSDAVTAVSALPPTAAGGGDLATANGTGGQSYPGYPPPYPPRMGGGGGGGAGSQEKERERTTWLAEEEEIWGTDPELGPAVIGRDESFDEEVEVPAWPQQRPGTVPAGPRQPSRGTTRSTGRG